MLAHQNKGMPMALIKCSECGTEISDKAASCPRCGNPMATISSPKASAFALPPPYVAPPAQPRKGGWLKWVFIVPVLLFAIVMVIGTMSDPDGTQAAARL